jgi:GDP-4-dehydro-6-deoxy-D-mannose reductase
LSATATQSSDVTPSRVLITGAAGFAGFHLSHAFAGAWPDAQLLRVGRETEAVDRVVDVTDGEQVDAALKEFQPDVIVNLAAVSHQSGAERDPDLAWAVNLHGARRLGEAALRHAPECFFVHASSAEVYGRAFEQRERVDENAPLAPTNLYALTKAAGDLAIGELGLRGLHTLRLRLFNYTGPRQTTTFVIPAFARQIARIEAGLQEPVIRVGALDHWRDFMDVEDVCRAHIAAIQGRAKLAQDAVLNVCSGEGHKIGDILGQLLELSSKPIQIESHPGPPRGHDLSRSVGDPTRIRETLGWSGNTPWRETLTRVLDYWRDQATLEKAQ